MSGKRLPYRCQHRNSVSLIATWDATVFPYGRRRDASNKEKEKDMKDLQRRTRGEKGGRRGRGYERKRGAAAAEARTVAEDGENTRR